MQWSVPSEAHDYELVYTTHRQNGFWRRSMTTDTRWRFESQTPTGEHEVLPLMTIDYDLALDKLSTAPAGTFRFGVRSGMPPEVETTPIANLAVEVSWDKGSTWQPAALRRLQRVRLRRAGAEPQRRGSASLASLRRTPPATRSSRP